MLCEILILMDFNVTVLKKNENNFNGNDITTNLLHKI